VSESSSTVALPARPNLDWYRKSARKKLTTLRAKDAKAILADAQLAIARESGFSSWRTLKQGIEGLTGQRLRDTAMLFERFAEQECHGSSPLYEFLAMRVAKDAELLAIASLGKTPIPNLFFAAVHLLLLNDRDDRLAAHYPSITANAAAPGSATFTAFRAFCLSRRDAVLSVMRKNLVQTNEVARCGYLRPALATAARELGGGPVALIEVGASAGLNLCFDRYAYDYGNGRIAGDARSAVRVRSECRGANVPELVNVSLDLRQRVGIDLNPIAPDDSAAVAWLRALIWPEHHDRRTALDAALAIRRAVDVTMIAGDASVELSRALASIPRDVRPIVFQTHALNQFQREAAAALTEAIATFGRTSPVAFVSRHGDLTLDVHTPAGHTSRMLAKTDGHGRWFEWTDTGGAVAALDPELAKQFSEAFSRDRGDVIAIRALLDVHPELVHCQPWLPNWQNSAIEAAAHQCVWHRPKMQEIAQLLVERGAVADLPTIARAGLLDELKRRLDADPSLVNKPDEKGRTPIYRAACTYGFFQPTIPVVQELIHRGATVDIFTAASWLMIERLGPMLAAELHLARATDPEGLTALHWVTRTDAEDKRQIEAAKMLLDAGADVEAPARQGESMRPLHCAAEWASSDALIELLIDRGADVNARTDKGWTPLDFAEDRNRAGARDVLRARGGRSRQQIDAAPVDATADGFLKLVNTGDLTAVAAAIDADPAAVHYVGAHPQWGGRPQALHVAIERGDKPMFDLLLSRGAKPEGENALYDHWSPLMLAIHWKRDAMRDELLKRSGHLSLISTLMMADDEAALRILRSGGIMLQRTMPNDATMLHFARTPVAAARLLELGVPLDAKDKYGKTPLDLAAERGDRALVDFLIARGATALPVTFARLGDLPRLKKAVGTHGEVDGKILLAAIASGDAKVVKWVLSRDVDVNEPSSDGGSTPLHQAAFAGNMGIVKLLVKAGANVHAEDDQYNSTPSGWAQYAATHLNRAECVEITGYLDDLMSKKWSVKSLPPHRQTHKVVGWKPIMDAAYNGDAALIRKLVKAGADPNVTATTPFAHRPLHRAIEEKKTFSRGKKHEAAVKALLASGADPRLRGGSSRLTALGLAAVGSTRFVPLLIDAFKPLDIFHACVMLDMKRVKALLDKDKTTATSRDEGGYTPLHMVAASKLFESSPQKLADQLAIAQLLIDRGADVNATYTYQGGGEWPIPVLYFACGAHNNPALTELLLKAGARMYDNESVYHASDEGHDACLAVLERYAEKKLLAVEASRCLATQMHWGKSRGAVWLMAHGADPNATYPQTGDTPLHSAVIHNAGDAVFDLLFKYGADARKKNKERKTPLELARSAMKPKERVVKLLEKRLR
jgi:ankyrin repeat protein